MKDTDYTYSLYTLFKILKQVCDQNPRREVQRDMHRDKKNIWDGPFSRKFMATFFSYFI